MRKAQMVRVVLERNVRHNKHHCGIKQLMQPVREWWEDIKKWSRGE